MYLIDTQIDLVGRQILSQTDTEISSAPSFRKIRWKSGLMELVELVYALHEANCFGKVSLKILFAFFGKVFDCEIPNFYRLFWDIKSRTGDERTRFLNKLRKSLTDKLIRMDGGVRS